MRTGDRVLVDGGILNNFPTDVARELGAEIVIGSSVASPLEKLNESVKEWEAGNMNPDIYIGGFTEVEHLGRTLKSTVEQIRKLMDDVLLEQEEKRKSELDALQSQINPHFLYNTLESITWMIEGERYEDAVFMIYQLASLFRMSLSKGRTIIRVEDFRYSSVSMRSTMSMFRLL